MLRLVALSAVFFMTNAQPCAFNAISIYAGTNRFTGLTVGTAFGGGIIDVTASSGNIADCQASGTVQDGDNCTMENMAGTAYSNQVIATCNGGTFTYSTSTLIALDCMSSNTGSASISPAHKFGETGVYTCPASTSCSVANCEAECNTMAQTVTPSVDCYMKCSLGNVIGQLVTTTMLGSDGSNCSGPLISVMPSSPTCSVTQVAGYTCPGLPVSLQCVTAGATMITSTCTENVCNTIDIRALPIALIGDPTNNDECGTMVTLSAVTDTSCDVMCDQSEGYYPQTGKYECTNTNGGVDPDLSISACVPVDCPPYSTWIALKSCVCNPGSTGVITYTGVTYSGNCTLIECDAYNFPTSPADIVGGDIDGCVGGDVLRGNETCTVKCATGYNNDTDVVTCDYSTTKQSTTSLTCSEKVCSSYYYGVGITGGLTNGCSNPQVLKQATAGSCTLACAAGYSGVNGTLDCPTTLSNGSAPQVNIVCSENTCSAYVLQAGEVAVAPGCDALGTVTGSNCSLNCDIGYTVGVGVVTCPPDSNQDDPPTVVSSPNCQRTCALHTCGTGYKPKAVLTTVCNITTGCTDVGCCDAANCPTSSTTTQTDPNLTPPSCECMDGFTGTATWDSAASAWSHTCIPHCGNQYFSGCDQNTGTRPNPTTIACSVADICDVTGCPACLQTDCCTENICNTPGTKFLSQHFGGIDGRQCTTVVACSPVTCADGYRGTPIIQCQNSGGDFSFNPDCDPVECPANASPPGECNCDKGYHVAGGGSTNFDTTSRSWTHTCALDPTPVPTAVPTTAPTPVPHPCDSGTHSCDTVGGICNALSDDKFECECVSGFVCTNGCNGTHTSHKCLISCRDYNCTAGNLLSSPETIACSGDLLTSCNDATCCREFHIAKAESVVVTSGVAMLTGAGSGGASRSVVVAHTVRRVTCFAELDDEDLDIFIHPLRFSVYGSFWAGAVVGGIALCVGIVLIHFLLHSIVKAFTGSASLKSVARKLRFPSAVMPPLLMSTVNIATCSALLLKSGKLPGIAILGVCCTIGIPGVGMWFFKLDETKCHYTRGDIQHSKLFVYFLGHSAWESINDDCYVEANGLMFDSHTEQKWIRGHYFLLEFWLTIPVVLVMFLNSCNARGWLLLVTQILQIILILKFRIYSCSFLSHLSVATALATCALIVCALADSDYQVELSTATLLLCVVRALYDLICFFLDVFYGIRELKVKRLTEHSTCHSLLSMDVMDDYQPSLSPLSRSNAILSNTSPGLSKSLTLGPAYKVREFRIGEDDQLSQTLPRLSTMPSTTPCGLSMSLTEHSPSASYRVQEFKI